MEEKFRFLRDDTFLIAQVNATTGRERLLMQKINPANGQVLLQDAIDCIHVAVGYIPTGQFNDVVNDEDFPEKVLYVRSSEQLKEVYLVPREKFEAFKSWVAGIAEAGPDAFKLEAEIEHTGKLAYPIASRLMAFAVKADQKLLENYLEGVVRACQHEGIHHVASLIANLSPFIQCAAGAPDTFILDIIFNLDIPVPVILDLIMGAPSWAAKYLAKVARGQNGFLESFKDYATTHRRDSVFIGTLRSLCLLFGSGYVLEQILDQGLTMPDFKNLTSSCVGEPFIEPFNKLIHFILVEMVGCYYLGC